MDRAKRTENRYSGTQASMAVTFWNPKRPARPWMKPG